MECDGPDRYVSQVKSSQVSIKYKFIKWSLFMFNIKESCWFCCRNLDLLEFWFDTMSDAYVIFVHFVFTAQTFLVSMTALH